MGFNWEERVKKHFIQAIELLIAEINPNSRPYQRPLESAWIGKLIDDYKMNGYDRSKPITLNEKKEIVDGQHRYEAAKEYGMIKIPAIIYSFDTYTDEVMEYFRQNDWHHSHNTKMYWNARNESQEPIAQLLYRLESDEISYLHNDINLYPKEGPLKYKIPSILTLVAYSIGINHRWNRAYDDKFREKVMEFKYDDIRHTIHATLQFIYDCWGKDKHANRAVYMSRVFEALIKFHKLLDINHRLTEKYRASAVKRMKNFRFDAAFWQTSDNGKVALLASHYDKGRGGGGAKLKLDF